MSSHSIQSLTDVDVGLLQEVLTVSGQQKRRFMHSRESQNTVKKKRVLESKLNYSRLPHVALP
jgi:hypothetical protein